VILVRVEMPQREVLVGRVHNMVVAGTGMLQEEGVEVAQRLLVLLVHTVLL